MTNGDKPVADKSASVEEPKVEEQPSSPIGGEEPVSGSAAPASSGSASAGSTDQHGRQLFDVTCASCGKPAQVPFKPSGNRPVYCRDCYRQQRGESDQRGGFNRGRDNRPRR